MRLLKPIFLLCLITYVACKTPINPLTESMGQEVIEIAAPIKELPQELEEEPSAEDEERHTSTVVPAATKKEFVKSTMLDPSKKVKDIDKIDGRRQQDDEARIEKELADIYKDSIDYKADSAEITSKGNVSTSAATTASSSEDITSILTDKPIFRAGAQEFKFRPDSTHPRDIARFRTSVDEINCRFTMSATKTAESETTSKSKAARLGRVIKNISIILLLYTVFI